MQKYYTRACNFYYGSASKEKIKKKLALPLNGNNLISFDTIEIITRKNKKKIHIREIKNQNHKNKKEIKEDIRLITAKKKFKDLNFLNFPILMGIINLTPDSFSDGGKYNNNLGYLHGLKLFNLGANIIDVGGESTRPGSKEVKSIDEWKRIKFTLKKWKRKKIPISLDTRKSSIIEKGIKLKVKLINDISGLNFDKETIKIIKKFKIPFVINHIQGSPSHMQKKPKYKNVLLDIYDYFEKILKNLDCKGIKHKNIIIDPGIGFGKNLKHNITLISNISIFHSLGFPILIGMSRKKFIGDISNKNDSKYRLGGTIGANLFALMNGVQILRVHDVNEIIQSVKIFKKLIKN